MAALNLKIVLLLLVQCTMLLAATISYCAIPTYQLAFPTADGLPRGFIMQDGANLTVTQSHAFPTFYLLIQDSFGNQQYDAGPALTVTAVGAFVNTESVDSYVQLSNNVVSGYNGIVTFSNLFLERGPQNSAYMKLRFKVTLNDPTATDPIVNHVLVSPPIRVETSQVNAHHIAIYPPQSSLQYLGQPLNFVSGQPMLPIRLAVMTSYGTVNRALTTLGAEQNFTFYADFAYAPEYPATLSGNAATALRGVATFANLVITCPTCPLGTTGYTFPPLVFYCPSLCCERPATGKLKKVDLVDNDLLMFETADLSAVWYDGQVISATNGATIPTIRVVLGNSIGVQSPTSQGLVLTATISASPSALQGGVVGVVNGVAEFNLRYYRCRDTKQQPYVITITAGNQITTVTNEYLRFVVLISATTFPGYVMRFRPSSVYSYFVREGQEAVVTSAVLNLPIGLELLDSSLSPSNVTGVIVSALLYTTVEGESLIESATFVDGRASFPALAVTPPTTVKGTNPVSVLLFRATTNDALTVAGQTLQSGALTLTSEILAFNIQFESTGNSHFSQQSQTSFATINQALPTIVVLMMTSGGNVDTTNSGVGITASASNGALLSNNFARTANGMAVFSSLTFVSDVTGNVIITFTVGSEQGTAAAGKTIVTGLVNVVASLTSNFAPAFSSGGYSVLEYPGQVISVTFGLPIPSVIVVLVDSAHGQPSSITDNAPFQDTIVTATAISGELNVNSTTVVNVYKGVAVFDELILVSGLDATLQFCVSGGTTAAAGKCVSSGPIAGHATLSNASGLAIVASQSTLIQPRHQTLSIERGTTITALVALTDSTNRPVAVGTLLPTTSIIASSNYGLTGTLKQDVNLTTGAADFSDLVFSSDVGVGVTPYITFTISTTVADAAQRLLRPVTSGLITVSNGAVEALSGVDVVAEILADLSTFSQDAWIATLAQVMNVETARFSVTYVYSGKSGVNEATTFDPVLGNFVVPVWQGVRLEMRTLPPLPTSVDLRTPQQLADFIVNMQPGCGGVQALYLRQAYLKSGDTSCDWLVFDNQMNGVRSCIQARGKSGYCGCYAPLMQTMGPRCIGMSRLSDLCLDILVSSQSANCKDKDVVRICTYFQYPDASREGLMISGTVLFFVWIYLAYGYSKSYFHGLGPTPRITTLSLPATSNAYETLL